MNSATTKGISVYVESQYESEMSKPDLFRYLHSYKVRIENHSVHTVKLISRRWVIVSADGSKKVVQGKGVIGEQPVLAPGDNHEYSSWSPIKYPLGCMYGTYTMKNVSTGESFKVEIPTFPLVAKFILN